MGMDDQRSPPSPPHGINTPHTLPASSALSLTQSQFNYTIVKSCAIVFSATQPVSRRIRQEFEFTWMTSRSNPSPAVGASTYVFRPSLVFSNATSEHWKLVQSLIKPTDECTVGMGGITSASRTPTIKSSGYHGGGVYATEMDLLHPERKRIASKRPQTQQPMAEF